jgi:hypothetical protein
MAVPIPQLAILLPLPAGGYGQYPEIKSPIVDLKDNPRGEQITAQAVQIEATTITSAQLLALKGADVLIINAPPPGYALNVQSISLRFNFNTTAYTLNSGTLKLYLGPSANGIPIVGDLSSILTQSATYDNIGVPTLASGVQTQAHSENVGIYLGNQGSAQFTLGDGTLDVIVSYLQLQM